MCLCSCEIARVVQQDDANDDITFQRSNMNAIQLNSCSDSWTKQASACGVSLYIMPCKEVSYMMHVYIRVCKLAGQYDPFSTGYTY